jgi:hypothetical protein
MAFLDDYQFDDSSGEALGTGMDSGAAYLSGDFALDEGFDDVATQGSTLDLGGAGGWGGINDSPSLEDEFNLSGVSDPMSDGYSDSGDWDTNGAGSASSTHPLTAQPASDVSALWGGVAKFGVSIGQMFMRGGASSQPVMVGADPNRNPYRSSIAGLAAGHTALILGAVLLFGAFVVLGGDK